MLKRSILALLTTAALALPALADEAKTITETPAAPAGETGIAAPAAALAPADKPAPSKPEARARARRMSPLAVAMAGVVESEKASMATLKALLAAARTSEAAESVQREIEQLKLDTEVQLLTLQATHHRQNGRPELAAELDRAIAGLRAPERKLEPASRPAPVTAPRSN